MGLRGPEKQPRVLVFLICHNLKIRNESYDALKFAKSEEMCFQFGIFQYFVLFHRTFHQQFEVPILTCRNFMLS